MNRTSIIILAGTVLVLGALNAAIFHTENAIASGRTVFLRLAPVDPRSLMQGDYMILNYAINRDDGVLEQLQGQPSRGTFIARLDEKDVATFARLDDGMPLADNEVRLRYRHRRWQIRTAPESFFFQEGHAERYEAAKYSELRISPTGAAHLIALRDENLGQL